METSQQFSSPSVKEAFDIKLENQARLWSAFYENLHKAEAFLRAMQATMEHQSPELEVTATRLKEAGWWFRDAMGWGFEKRAEEVLRNQSSEPRRP